MNECKCIIAICLSYLLSGVEIYITIMLRPVSTLLRYKLGYICRRTGPSLLYRNFSQTCLVTQENKPWYLNVPEVKDTDNNSPFITPITFPSTPVPHSVKIISEHLNDKLAVTNIIVFDTAHSNTTTSIHSMAKYVIIGTVRSFRHLQSCNDELVKFVKTEFGCIPKSEGLITSGILKKRQRRINRKTNIGKVTKKEQDESGWCLIASNVDGVFINIMTEERRNELNLEELYCPPEDMEQYQKKQQEQQAKSFVDEEDNVLLGLRKLMMKNTKRYYSTAAENSTSVTLEEALTIQDLKAASNLLQQEPKPYLTITSVLGSLPTLIEIDTKGWVELFNQATSTLHHLDEEYWSSRFKFFQLLYLSKTNNLLNSEQRKNGDVISLNQELNYFINDFFRFKQTMLYQPTREELIKFIQICNHYTNMQPNYNGLMSANFWITRALKSYQYNDPEAVHDPRVVRLLLSSMHKDTSNLNALYEYIHLITNEFKLNHLSDNIIKEIIGALVETANWAVLFRFWNHCLIEFGGDSGLWAFFLKSLLEKNDPYILAQLMEKGNLIWIHRAKVEINPELKKVLVELFDKFDNRYTNLKTLLNL